VRREERLSLEEEHLAIGGERARRREPGDPPADDDRAGQGLYLRAGRARSPT